MANDNVEIQHEPGDRVRVKVSGELDLDSAARLLSGVMGLLDGRSRDLIVDLKDVSFIDSTGLSILLLSARRTDDAGGRLRVAGAHGPVLDAISLAGAQSLLEIQESPSSA